MDFDALDGGVVEIVVAETMGIAGEPFRKRRRRWIALRSRHSRRDRDDGCARDEMQKPSAWKFHRDPSQPNSRAPHARSILERHDPALVGTGAGDADRRA